MAICVHFIVAGNTLKLDLPATLKSELGQDLPLPNVGDKNVSSIESLSDEDRDNLARVMSVDALTWFKIHQWGKKDGNLNEWQCGIAHTLSGYAAGGWTRVPSQKQAKRAAEILDLVPSE